ncbi:MAG TPA: endonuclease/exonuclease/phosphatase family protein [Kofleriaceae bacterium]|nr:endonuclease/exonuclease/phosphatase family protein [Kofleriaceae bacterium]
MRIFAAAVCAVLAFGALRRCEFARNRAREPLVVATFNIEEFPKDDAQVDGAFAILAGTGAQVIALEEIFDAGAAEAAAQRWLGPSWRFASAGTTNGVAYDTRAFTFVRAALHRETSIDGRGMPTTEIVLRDRSGDELHLFVVHLKSGAAGRGLRAKQHAGLRAMLAGAHGRTIVLGDFNATEDADRDDLAALATTTHLTWATEPLACTAFWRRDEDCPTSRLDHALTWTAPSEVRARGACDDGCDVRDRCPAYRDVVSDHCPVVISLP